MRAPKRSTLAASEGHHLAEGDKLGSSSETQQASSGHTLQRAHASPASLIERLDSNGRSSARGYDRSDWRLLQHDQGRAVAFIGCVALCDQASA